MADDKSEEPILDIPANVVLFSKVLCEELEKDHWGDIDCCVFDDIVNQGDRFLGADQFANVQSMIKCLDVALKSVADSQP